MTTYSREDLTFSQAQGLEPLPGPLKLGELSHEVRNAIFAVLVKDVNRSRDPTRNYVSGTWRQMLERMHIDLDHKPLDEFNPRVEVVLQDLKGRCYGWSYNKLLDLLELFARHERYHLLFDALNEVFEQHRAPYRLIKPGPNIVPITTEEEGRAVLQAFADLGADEFAGSRKHLRDAGVLLGQPGKEADSVRESIHAVEAVCKVVAGMPGATLTSALNRIKNKVQMHSAFTEALSRLYSYTSDEKGVRHALLGEAANVDAADAQFMFSACAAFVSFLIGKVR